MGAIPLLISDGADFENLDFETYDGDGTQINSIPGWSSDGSFIPWPCSFPLDDSGFGLTADTNTLTPCDPIEGHYSLFMSPGEDIASMDPMVVMTNRIVSIHQTADVPATATQIVFLITAVETGKIRYAFTLGTNNLLEQSPESVPGPHAETLLKYSAPVANLAGETATLRFEMQHRFLGEGSFMHQIDNIHFLPLPTFYASPTGGHIHPFTSWATAATTLQAVAEAAPSGAEIIADNGVYDSGYQYGLRSDETYYIARVSPRSDVTLRSRNGPRHSIILGEDDITCVYLPTHAHLEGFTLSCPSTLYPTTKAVEGNAGSSVSNCIIRDSCSRNRGGWGHALANTRIVNSIVACNTNLLRLFSQCEVEHCVITRNSTETTMDCADETTTLRNCIIVSNSNLSVSLPAISYSCLDSVLSGEGNIAADPRFASAPNGDYRLLPDSPCIDAGTQTVNRDFESIPRPLDGNNDGIALPDMGCHEYVHPLADSDHDGLNDTNELFTFGTNPTLADTDGDHQSDGNEILAGTNPLNPGSYFGLAGPGIADTTPLITWRTVYGKGYWVQRKTDLLVHEWVNVGASPVYETLHQPEGELTIEDPTAPTNTPLFYRVILE